jgi:CheY-like chemotaxis protein
MANILLVDDSPIMLELHGRYLRNAGHHVTTVTSGQAALEAAAVQTPDLVVLDYLMPGMSGDQLLERLHEFPRTRSVPTLILTAGEHEPTKLARAIELGVTAYMLKPISREVFVARVAALLNGR